MSTCSSTDLIRVSAPGSIMLMGEHAVLRGARAIACAVNQYMHLELRPRQDRAVRVFSALGDYQATLDALPDEPALSFVVAALRRWQSRLPCGFELRIESEFGHTLGLGSSAAVVAALTCALARFSASLLSAAALFDEALAVIHTVQNGRGSGTDLAASLYGGLIAYRVAPRELQPLPGEPAIGLWYVGYKMKTPAVLELVERQSGQFPTLYQALDQLMAQTVEQAVTAIETQKWSRLGQLMNVYQGLMDALAVNDANLSAIVYALRATPGVLGSKISGSGLGDCVVALAAAEQSLVHPTVPGEQIPVTLGRRGALDALRTGH